MRKIATLGLTFASTLAVISSIAGAAAPLALARESDPGDDRGGHHRGAEAGDDHGRRHGGHGADDGRVTISRETEPGDDHGGPGRGRGRGTDDASPSASR